MNPARLRVLREVGEGRVYLSGETEAGHTFRGPCDLVCTGHVRWLIDAGYVGWAGYWLELTGKGRNALGYGPTLATA